MQACLVKHIDVKQFFEPTTGPSRWTICKICREELFVSDGENHLIEEHLFKDEIEHMERKLKNAMTKGVQY